MMIYLLNVKNLITATICVVHIAACTPKTAGIFSSNAKNESATPAIKLDCTATDTMLISGAFQGSNLYFLNPQLLCADSTPGHSCVLVVINDSIVIPKDSCAKDAFEVPLKEYNLEMNSPVLVKLIHIEDSRPRLLNPEVR